MLEDMTTRAQDEEDEASVWRREFMSNSKGLWAFENQMRGERIREWNEAQSRIYPHCQICLLFKKNRINDQLSSNLTFARHLPINSEKLVPEICFSKSAACKSNFLANAAAATAAAAAVNDAVNDENIDRLMQCKMCKLTVHQSMTILIYSLKT